MEEERQTGESAPSPPKRPALGPRGDAPPRLDEDDQTPQVRSRRERKPTSKEASPLQQCLDYLHKILERLDAAFGPLVK